MLSRATRAILEKAVLDNGFSLDDGGEGEWLIWKAHAAPARLCLAETAHGFGVGSDHLSAMRGVEGGTTSPTAGPVGFEVVEVSDITAVNAVAATVWRLARSLPEEPLRKFRERLSEPPSSTETERLRKERIGQDVFREALMLFWDGACAVTGVRNPRLLRASHIVPWAECENDAERLNVHNGLLLAAHLDAAFDSHLISFDSNGKVLFSPRLSLEDRTAAGLSPEMQLTVVHPETEIRLAQHRKRLEGRLNEKHDRLPRQPQQA